MRINIILAGLAAAQVAAASDVSAPPDEAPLHRLVAILDYVASDYPGAVKDGRIVSVSEHEEQVTFAQNALDISRSLSGPGASDLSQVLVELVAACRAAAPAEKVQALARSARHQVVDRYGLVQSPAGPPSLEHGAKLFQTNCAVCHGAAGFPPQDKLEQLKPPPRTLADRSVVAPLSPYRVFNDLAFGVEGTGMASFDTLPPADRWDLAFYVLTLRSDPKPASSYPRSLGALNVLAASTDDELRSRLRSGGVTDVEGALDALRRVAPYSASAALAPIATTRRLLDKALAAANEGRSADARALLVDAYLQGFERAEAPLRARDASLVDDVEGQFLQLRAAVDRNAPRALASGADRLRRLLARAEYRLDAASQGRWFGIAGAAILVVREGMEAALLILLLLASVGGVGRPEAMRYIHAGWLLALAAGGVTFALAQGAAIKLALPSELVEAIASLLAAAVLFYVSNWLMGQIQAARWVAFVKEKMQASLSAGRLAAIFGLAFLAVYREAFESVLFFEGLLAGTDDTSSVVVGAAAGGVTLVALVVALRRLGSRLPLRAFFASSGALLYALCVVFAGKGVHALIAAGVIAPHPFGAVDIPTIGVFPDLWTLLTQAVLVAAIGASMLVLRLRKLVPPAEHPAAG